MWSSNDPVPSLHALEAETMNAVWDLEEASVREVMDAVNRTACHVHYSLTPVESGCEMDAHVSIHPSRGRVGRLVAHAAPTLLAAGTLDDALERIAREAERSVRRCERGLGRCA
jgi:hypothetical protein